MLVAYMMAFLDKQTLNYAALMGLQEDLHLVGSQYSWTSGIFYFGYLFFSWAYHQFPRFILPLLTLTLPQISSLVTHGQISTGQILGYQLVCHFLGLLNVAYILQYPVGHSSCLPCGHQELCHSDGNQVPARMYWGKPIPWVHFDHLPLVSHLWAAPPCRYLVLWKLPFSYLRQPHCSRYSAD